MSNFPTVRTEAHESVSYHASSSHHSASLQTLKDFYVGSLHSIIALWVSNGYIANLYAKIFVVPLECATGELGPAVSDDPVQDPKLADVGLDQLDCRLLVDLDHMGRFQPLGEFVDGDIKILGPFNCPGEWPQDVQPPNNECP
jgi:hypothetical protein